MDGRNVSGIGVVATHLPKSQLEQDKGEWEQSRKQENINQF